MSQTGHGDLAQVVEADVEAPGEQRPHLGGQHQALHAARAGAVTHVMAHRVGGAGGLRVGGHDQADGVVLDVRGQRHVAHQALRRQHVGGRGDRLRRLRLALGGAVDDVAEVAERRVVDLQFEQEAVELRLRQRVGAVHFERVLGGQHQERQVQLVLGAGHRHRLLLHGFEQRRLGFRRRAVDLVGEHHVAEDRTGLEGEVALPGLVFEDHAGADDVGRHQVGGELDAREVKVQGGAEALHQQRLAQPGHAFQKGMAAAQQAGEQAVDDVAVPHDGLGDFAADARHVGAELRHLVGYVHTVSTRSREKGDLPHKR